MYNLSKTITNLKSIVFFGGLLLFLSCSDPTPFPQTTADQDWPYYGGNAGGNRYSPLTQINSENVRELQVAWTYYATDTTMDGFRPREIQCQPIILDGILYGTSSHLDLFALRADTGEELWKFKPFANKKPRYHSNRGVMYWEDGQDKRILYTAGSFLYAVNAQSGEIIKSFGEEGMVSLYTGIWENLGRGRDDFSIIATSPGIVYKDLVIMGSTVSEAGDAAPGHIRAFDIRTGDLKWIFHTIPEPGEFGYDTWPEDTWKFLGGANNWAGMVLDEARGMVFLGTGSPSVDFYGAARTGQNLFANCILAIHAETGKLAWHYQTVHHDLWDRDIACQPNLVTVTHDGKSRDAVAQATKDGLIFLLDRDSGIPLFPVEDRPALTGYALPDEEPWPTQPFPLKPAPFARQVFTEDDITDITPEAQAFVKERFLQTRSGSKFMPLSKEGTLVFGIGGGANWGGNASEPEGILYQNSNEMVWDIRMVETKLDQKDEKIDGRGLYMSHCAPCHGLEKHEGKEFPSLVEIGERLSAEKIENIIKSGQGRMPSFQHISDRERKEIINHLLNTTDKGNRPDDIHSQDVQRATDSKSDFPYIPPYTNNGLKRFLDPNGYPAIKPPWGTLNAIDLNSGEYLWQVPLGEFPELTAKGIPVTGTESYGGPIVTAGGLVFIAATRDEKLRAFDKKTGKVIWEYQLPAGGFATPATYQLNGKQYLVIAVGGVKDGNKPGGYYMAFTLP
ncbi:PQQ-binding-like beta-propeller repeat protein [Aquiflexum sp.]|uniref:outer membrane protein assembly factor BamB family protein n=1 Tax=Aquiflexum sp. TaxID=1872584 RepID=UPI00359484F6